MTPKRVRFLVLSLIGIGLIAIALFGVRAYYAWREVRGRLAADDPGFFIFFFVGHRGVDGSGFTLINEKARGPDG